MIEQGYTNAHLAWNWITSTKIKVLFLWVATDVPLSKMAVIKTVLSEADLLRITKLCFFVDVKCSQEK